MCGVSDAVASERASVHMCVCACLFLVHVRTSRASCPFAHYPAIFDAHSSQITCPLPESLHRGTTAEVWAKSDPRRAPESHVRHRPRHRPRHRSRHWPSARPSNSCTTRAARSTDSERESSDVNQVNSILSNLDVVYEIVFSDRSQSETKGFEESEVFRGKRGCLGLL